MKTKQKKNIIRQGLPAVLLLEISRLTFTLAFEPGKDTAWLMHVIAPWWQVSLDVWAAKMQSTFTSHTRSLAKLWRAGRHPAVLQWQTKNPSFSLNMLLRNRHIYTTGRPPKGNCSAHKLRYLRINQKRIVIKTSRRHSASKESAKMFF